MLVPSVNYFTFAAVVSGPRLTLAIDQYAEKALGNRNYFLNKPYGVG